MNPPASGPMATGPDLPHQEDSSLASECRAGEWWHRLSRLWDAGRDGPPTAHCGGTGFPACATRAETARLQEDGNAEHRRPAYSSLWWHRLSSLWNAGRDAPPTAGTAMPCPYRRHAMWFGSLWWHIYEETQDGDAPRGVGFGTLFAPQTIARREGKGCPGWLPTPTPRSESPHAKCFTFS